MERGKNWRLRKTEPRNCVRPLGAGAGGGGRTRTVLPPTDFEFLTQLHTKSHQVTSNHFSSLGNKAKP